jgi:hypothetical protein
VSLVAPHLALPLTVVNGRFQAVEQSSPRHLQDQAEVVCRTRPGTLEADPDMGLRELVARLGPAAPEVLDAVTQYVPDARFRATEDESLLAERIRSVALELETEQGS